MEQVGFIKGDVHVSTEPAYRSSLAGSYSGNTILLSLQQLLHVGVTQGYAYRLFFYALRQLRHSRRREREEIRYLSFIEVNEYIQRTCLNVFSAQLIIQLKISQKAYSQASFGAFNTGYGTTAFSPSVPGTAGTADAQASNGMTSQDAVRTLSIPQHIGGQEKYQLQILNPTGNACDFGIVETAPPTSAELATLMATVRVEFWGLYKRPVS